MNCKHCGEQFIVTTHEQQLLQRWDMPQPTLCSNCRLRQRYAFRNETALFQRNCDMCATPIIALYNPNRLHKGKPLTVYCHECWWSDKWDATDYGRPYDPTRPFIEQLQELSVAVPHIATYITNSENSNYSSFGLNLKDCYLITGGGNNENCLYGKFVVQSTDVIDTLSVYSCELGYELVSCERCYNCRYATNSRDCTDSLMIEDCQASKYLIGCYGLYNKEYYVFNEPVTKDEYEQILAEYTPLTHKKIAELRKKLNELKQSLPQPAAHIYNSEDTSGEFVLNSSKCHNCYDLRGSENCANVAFVPNATDCMDCTFGAPDGMENSYQACSASGLRDSYSVFLVWNSYKAAYSLESHNSHDIFGSVGLRNKSFMILNQEYPEAEYKKIREQIIQELQHENLWGEFLPPELSLHGYNETLAGEYFPADQAVVEALGYNWQTPDDKVGLPSTYVVPSSIDEVGEDILKATLQCDTCHKNYRIIQGELHVYKKLQVPIPTSCSFCRREARRKLKGGYSLFARECTNCSRPLETIKSADQASNILCNSCWHEQK